MKSEAIRCAIKLYSEPELLARFNDPFRQLPRGITELLRIVSSDTALKKISSRNNLHAYHFKKILINYIQTILLREKNSDLRKLGLTNSSDSLQHKLHYKLLMNIFHPDKSNNETNPHYYTQLIASAYKNIKTSPSTPSFTKIPSSHITTIKNKNCQTNANNPYSNLRNTTSVLKKHLTKPILSLFLIIIFTAVFLLLTPSAPQLTVKKVSPLNIIPPNETSKVIDTIDKTGEELLSSIRNP